MGVALYSEITMLISVSWKCPSCTAEIEDAYYKKGSVPEKENCPNCGNLMNRVYKGFTENRTWSKWQGEKSTWGLKDAQKIGNYQELQRQGEVE